MGRRDPCALRRRHAACGACTPDRAAARHAVRLPQRGRPRVARRASLAHVRGRRRRHRLRRLRARGPLPEAATHRRGSPPLSLCGRCRSSRGSALQGRHRPTLMRPVYSMLYLSSKVVSVCDYTCEVHRSVRETEERAVGKVSHPHRHAVGLAVRRHLRPSSVLQDNTPAAVAAP